MIEKKVLLCCLIQAINISKTITWILGIAVSNLFCLAPAIAAILVEPVLTTPNPNLRNSDFDIGVNPPRTLLVWNAPDISGQQNFLNAGSGLNINNIELFLLPDFDQVDDDVIWGDVDGDGQIGTSDIFNNIEIDNDFILEESGLVVRAPRVRFTGGVIPLGTRFVSQTPTLPDLTPPPESGDAGPLLIGGRYDGITVLEPSSVIGLCLTIGFGILLNQKTSLQRQN